MKRYFLWTLCLIVMLPVAAQDDFNLYSSKGKDFYFTLLDFWSENDTTGSEGCFVTAIDSLDFTAPEYILYTNPQIGNTIHFTNNYWRYSFLHSWIEKLQEAVLKGVHAISNIQCQMFIVAEKSGLYAATAILPKHLLGRQYMVQSMPGDLINYTGVPTKTYSQFTIVGTEDGTNIVVKPRIDLLCVSTGQKVQAGKTASFNNISESQVLLFQPTDYTKDISGTLINSTRPIAVFQGNNLTRISPGKDSVDVTWEQARPTKGWGKEFIVAKSVLQKENVCRITALEDHTELYLYHNGIKEHQTTLQAGESADQTLEGANQLVTMHLETSKPACCYLYTTGTSQSNEEGGPSMTEIVPVDNMATEAYDFALHLFNIGRVINLSLLISAREEDEDHILYANRPLSFYATRNGTKRVLTDGYVTYEIPRRSGDVLDYTGYAIRANGRGFSAYCLETNYNHSASSYNISIPYTPLFEPCPDGILLFREDFGGNDVNDPEVGTTSIDGMAYQQIYSTQNGMDKGHYLVSKHGYENGTGWFRIDDHTYPNDPDKGYFMEVDGAGSGSYFYKHTIGNIAPGSQLTFSAYVANVTTPSGYIHIKEAWKYLYPRLTFSIVNPHTSEEIARYTTDTIEHDWTYYGQSDEYLHSPQWQHVGIRFTMPNDLDSIELRLINNVVQDNSSGNDFAIDDIEIRLCVPQVTIVATDTVCIDTKNTFIAEVENDGSFLEPLEYQWFFSADSIHWEPLAEADKRLYTLKAKPRHTGWYKVAVSGPGGISSGYIAAESEPFKLFVIEDCPPILCPDGILVFNDIQGGIATPYSTTIDGLCAGSDLSFIASVTNKSNLNPRLLFVLKDPASGRDLGVYDTGDLPADNQWHKVGMNLTVPDDVSSVNISIRTNGVGLNDTDLAIDSIEARLCLEPISIVSTDTVCRKYPHTLQANYDNFGILQSPEYQWSFSQDSLSWTVLQTDKLKSYEIHNVHKADEGWYRVSVANTGNNDMVKCRSVSEPFHLMTTYCFTATDLDADTTVCDTLLPYTWHEYVWPTIGTIIDTIRDYDSDDSIYVHLTLRSNVCCPDMQTVRIDTAICDTLLPFLWLFRDTMLFYTDAGAQDIALQHPKWENCIDSLYILRLDTFHCERLYPIIVNKYNWQLLLDYTVLRQLFPEQMPLEFQWYKDGTAVSGATMDEYAERDELHGTFQLRVRMNNGQDVWSNIIEILDTQAPLPITKRIYNSNGFPIREDQMTQGIYIIQYQQGDHIWAEKKIIQ